MTLVPPDAELQALARRIGEEAAVGRVDFYGEEKEHGVTAWLVVYQDGPRRATVRLQARPTEADVVDISTALRSWARHRKLGSLYTTELPRAPASEWS